MPTLPAVELFTIWVGWHCPGLKPHFQRGVCIRMFSILSDMRLMTRTGYMSDNVSASDRLKASHFLPQPSVCRVRHVYAAPRIILSAQT